MSDPKAGTTIPSYPIYDLARCLEVGEAVHNYGGARAGVDKSQIAAHLKMSETSSSFASLMAAAKSFGIITGRRDYTLTDAAQTYYSPPSEIARRESLLKFLASPPTFLKLVEQFDGTKLPAGEYLANVFSSKLHVGKSWAGPVARIFLKAADMAGALDPQGFLRYQANLRGIQSGAGQPRQEPVERGAVISEAAAPPQDSPKTRSDDVNVWVFTVSGRTVRLETPHELSPELWQKLQQYVHIIKPVKEAKND